MDAEDIKQIEQRGAFQFRLIEFNIVWAAVITSLALKVPDLWDALLLIPFVSLVLLLLWFHHGVVICLKSTKRTLSDKSHPFWYAVQVASFTAAILANFAGIPLAARWLHGLGIKALPEETMRLFGICSVVVICLLFGLWAVLQYGRATKSGTDGAADAEK